MGCTMGSCAIPEVIGLIYSLMQYRYIQAYFLYKYYIPTVLELTGQRRLYVHSPVLVWSQSSVTRIIHNLARTKEAANPKLRSL